MRKILKVSSFLAIFVGSVLVVGGVWGICFTYKNITQENIVTPEDATVPGVPVKGPLSLKAQVDIIRKHTLSATEGKTFAQMPRQVQKMDEEGNPVVDAEGKKVMIPNTARDIWITATTLMTALNLGILTYVFSTIIILLGLISIWTGVVFCVLSRKILSSLN